MVYPQRPEAVPAPAEPANPLAGTSYRLTRLLGEGSMGQVWEAVHVGLRRKVVVKLLRREYAERPDFMDRLRLEGQALAAITPHPHIVGVLDLGVTSDGRGFLVMEPLSGCTLRQALAAKGFFPVLEAVELTRQLLDGLGAAHRAGILHRDVKLDNLFLCSSPDGPGTLKILDFGIAKVISGAEEGPAPLHQPTSRGTTLGTPRFMSPEQARGGVVDHRTDLYSAGIVLYMLLAGRDPFHHWSGIFELLKAQSEEEPQPPSALAPQPIPEAIERVVLRALAKPVDERFEGAASFSAELLRAAGAPRWQETERLDVSMFRAPPQRPAPVSAVRSAADDPTCVLTEEDPPVEDRLRRPERLDAVARADRMVPALVGACLLVALITGAALWALLWSPAVR
jgi:eukaryotic-like serine/threonine-protein kinase